ncbi:MAG: DUF3052 domain-containing protein [Thermoanaerobaculia bacterium]
MTAGYSGTPLPKKLGLKPGIRAAAVHAPKHYSRLHGPLPGIRIASRLSRGLDFVHAFFTSPARLAAEFPRLKASLTPAGMLWISWPKKTSRIPGDIDESIVRNVGLRNGLVDVKVCAVDEGWSGLKFVYRLKDR